MCFEGLSPRRTRNADGTNPTPHLYLDSEGRMDVSGSKIETQRAAAESCNGAGIERLESFVTFLSSGGGLDMCPLVALQCLRGPRAGCLHVRRGHMSHKPGCQLQLLYEDGGGDGSRKRGGGSLWGMQFLGGGAADGSARMVALRSAHCGAYLHVRDDAAKLRGADGKGADKWKVLTLHPSCEDAGSKWLYEPAAGAGVDGQQCCTFHSARTGQFLHVRESFESLQQSGAKERVLMLSSAGGSKGSTWQLLAAHPSMLDTPRATILTHSYEIELQSAGACSSSSSSSSAGGTQLACSHDIRRDGEPWVAVETIVDTEEGEVGVQVRPHDEAAAADHGGGGGGPEKPPLHVRFDPLTGCVVGEQHTRTYRVGTPTGLKHEPTRPPGAAAATDSMLGRRHNAVFEEAEPPTVDDDASRAISITDSGV